MIPSGHYLLYDFTNGTVGIKPYTAMIGAYGIPTPKPDEPKLTWRPETPAEQRINDAAAKRGWGNRPAPTGQVRFWKPGRDDVVVTREALGRMPALPDQIAKQLERG